MSSRTRFLYVFLPRSTFSLTLPPGPRKALLPFYTPEVLVIFLVAPFPDVSLGPWLQGVPRCARAPFGYLSRIASTFSVSLATGVGLISQVSLHARRRAPAPRRCLDFPFRIFGILSNLRLSRFVFTFLLVAVLAADFFSASALARSACGLISIDSLARRFFFRCLCFF